MKYTIFSVSNDRKQFINNIVKTCHLERIDIECVNGMTADLPKLLDDAGWADAVSSHEKLYLKGQLGIWLTVRNALIWCVENDEELVTFEDDALLSSKFQREFEHRYEHLPNDYDFFTLFIARDHTHWHKSIKKINDDGTIVDPEYIQPPVNPYSVNGIISEAYQRYGGVSMLYSSKGARKALKLLEKGIAWQYDEWMYLQQRLGNLVGYTSSPDLKDLVYITGTTNSIVQETEAYYG